MELTEIRLFGGPGDGERYAISDWGDMPSDFRVPRAAIGEGETGAQVVADISEGDTDAPVVSYRLDFVLWEDFDEKDVWLLDGEEAPQFKRIAFYSWERIGAWETRLERIGPK